ncbi:hypothetical protein [Thiomicrorhabdus sp.]|uniref:hypothetical protein n=1 Tax=Thiomicrorhabdus sp. TaxID=2039724 RepID=UPI002AA8785B|nr:hypothetical protein [Thiomicrorhabdus sp.]
MIAKRRGFYKEGKEIIRTPLLLPSFSSKGFPEINNIFRATEEVIDAEILVSAYDIHHAHLSGPFEFTEAVFLDSGGYEASIDMELSDIRKKDYVPQEWNIDLYSKIVDSWECERPTVVISYDHPNERFNLLEQIDRAKNTLPKKDNVFREILIKPEEDSERYINIEEVIKNVKHLDEFDAVGFTEKELGNTQEQRMKSIYEIRTALNSEGLGDKPIHIFGSLDPISTPLYFLCGADIFDGLTWLRFAYHEGFSIYKHNYAFIKYGVSEDTELIEARCSFENYYFLKQLQHEMRNFLQHHDFNSFSYHGDLFKESFSLINPSSGV